MGINFRERAARLQQELADVEGRLKTAPVEQHVRLRATLASLKRSLRWYQARAGTRTDKHALGACVAEEIGAADVTL